jgi:phosphotransferase system HPr (HPr) family protein
MEEAREVKNFLDDFEARSNRQFAFLTELVLSVVTFSAVIYLVKHLLMRYPRYHLRDERPVFVAYHHKAQKFLEFSYSSIERLLQATRDEAQRLGVTLPSEKLDESSFSDLLPRQHLPHNVDDRESEIAAGEVPVLATLFLHFADQFESIRMLTEIEPGAIKEFLDSNCTEEHVRQWEASVHVIQRKYDTLVKNTSWDSRDEDLRALRGHISMVLHHFEMLRYLRHYLDHLDDGIKYEPAAGALSDLIDRDELLRQMYHYGFEMAIWYVNQGRVIARTLLSRYTKVLEKRLTLPHNTILHARPASLIVGIVNRYGTPVSMKIAGVRCDASSIMQVMMAIGNHPKEREVVFRGDQKPLRDLEVLFQHNLGEDGLEKLPEELGYLRPGAPTRLLSGH